ncbi:hypothetical protein IAD21_03508 [Abditibacteriota bacterium]|nr:hypothetical protein IAD21_03508 [Abditibacteriota bacterium]
MQCSFWRNRHIKTGTALLQMRVCDADRFYMPLNENIRRQKRFAFNDRSQVLNGTDVVDADLQRILCLPSQSYWH